MRSVLLSTMSILIILTSAAYGADDSSLSSGDVRARVEKLIGKLGDAQFEQREYAQAQLESMGLVAFEALHDAIQHDDIEIAIRVKTILSHLQKDWARPEDTAAVKGILKSYGEEDAEKREALLGRLAQQEDAAGVPALCRIARYETTGLLAEYAALQIMKREGLSDKEKTSIVNIIRDRVGRGGKPAVDWLHAYAESLINAQESLAKWDSLVEAELTRVGNAPHPEREKKISRELLYWNSRLLVSVGERERSNAVLERSFDFINGHREDLMEVADRLIEHEAWGLVTKLSAQYKAEFSKSNDLLYRLAEAQQSAGENEAAQTTVVQARAIAPDQPTLHTSTAAALQRRGLIDWADAEYRIVIDGNELTSYYALFARVNLSEMMHDHGRDTKAAAALEPLVTAMEDRKVEAQIKEAYRSREPKEIRARYFFFLSRSESKDQAKLLASLRRGIAADPYDVDVLIAMYRVPDADKTWQRETEARIEEASTHYRNQIAFYEEQVARADPGSDVMLSVAMYSNQFAWLIANTIGDYDEAARHSHRSLEIKPNTAAYLDTLGRCYFAKQDYKNAVKYQRQAVKIDPHSGLLQKQLALFEKALADSHEQK